MPEIERAEIARGVGELYEPLADDKGIQLKVEAPAAAPVHGNRELVSQALANLVDNAIKYGAPDGARGDGAHAQIVVTPGARQPGARQSGRQRHQIWRARRRPGERGRR